MGKLRAAIALLLLMASPVAMAQTKGSGSGSGTHDRTGQPPYSGLAERQVPALSDEDVAGILDGRGMGFALPAELNGYPGPLHVLEHADALKLTPDQRSRVQASFDFMQAQAQGLGRTYIEAEKALAAVFREGRAEAKIVAERIKAVEALRSELRQVHLLAHIETAALLTAQQKAIYEALRGYIRAQPTSAKGSGSGSGSGRGSSSANAQCRPGSTQAGSGCCCGAGGCGSGSASCGTNR